MNAPSLTGWLTVNPMTFSSQQSALDWFQKFAASDDERASDAALQQMSRIEMTRDQLINIGEGARSIVLVTARTHPFTFGEFSLNPDNVVESGRLYLRVVERFRADGDQLALSQIDGQREAPISFLTPAIIRLQQMGLKEHASRLLSYLGESSAALSLGVPQLPNRGV